MKLKICGNHNPQDLAALAPYAGQIDYLGFIFTPHSKRYVSPACVKQWLQRDPRLIAKAVAVFLDQPLTEVCRVLENTGIRHVQLHGTESAAYCQALRHRLPQLTIWKMIPVSKHAEHVQGEDRLVQLSKHVQDYLPAVDVILLDTQVKGQAGGTGQSFDWRLVPGIYAQVQDKKGPKGERVQLFVAGGIGPANIRRLLAMGGMDGIDMASGAETDGRKDARKIETVVHEVREHAQN
ncbi:phosphoribosylanthranilate isomerase [Caldalkalibacillus thermarum]|uniref:phosphoribosylanthranilate isomerase n=1 Tax=Caldalkalibacillus thermarum TaxID=296745 RepID=UPI0013050DCA|nr:hypothetical protein [Caldalkalibacillus thermarum]